MSNINIQKPIDVEEEARVALSPYVAAYVRPLPENYTLPCVEITATGGGTKDTIDTPVLTLSARARTDAEALDTLQTALGVLEAQASAQVGNLRHITINSLAQWGNDPVRKDLKLCTATVLVTCHRAPKTIQSISS